MARTVKKPNPHQLILDKTREILIKKGEEDITARNIAARCGYSLGSMYNYFKNIDDIVLQINSETLDGLYNLLKELNAKLPKLSNKLIVICHEYFDYAFSNKELWSLVMNYNRTGPEKYAIAYQSKVENIIELVEEIISPYLKKGQRKDEMAKVLWSGMHGIWQLTTRQGFKRTTPKEAKKMVEILVKNLFN